MCRDREVQITIGDCSRRSDAWNNACIQALLHASERMEHRGIHLETGEKVDCDMYKNHFREKSLCCVLLINNFCVMMPSLNWRDAANDTNA